MEKNNEPIQDIIIEIISLLREHDEKEWADYLDKLHSDFCNEKNNSEILKNILNIYKGGMGSFSDLTLHKNFKMLINENNKLAKLKTELYDACLDLYNKNKK